MDDADPDRTALLRRLLRRSPAARRSAYRAGCPVPPAGSSARRGSNVTSSRASVAAKSGKPWLFPCSGARCRPGWRHRATAAIHDRPRQRTSSRPGAASDPRRRGRRHATCRRRRTASDGNGQTREHVIGKTIGGRRAGADHYRYFASVFRCEAPCRVVEPAPERHGRFQRVLGGCSPSAFARAAPRAGAMTACLAHTPCRRPRTASTSRRWRDQRNRRSAVPGAASVRAWFRTRP